MCVGLIVLSSIFLVGQCVELQTTLLRKFFKRKDTVLKLTSGPLAASCETLFLFLVCEIDVTQDASHRGCHWFTHSC